MENPIQVVDKLPKQYQVEGATPPGKAVLEAALKVEQIGDDVKSRITKVLEVFPKLEAAIAAAPASLEQFKETLKKNLNQKNIEEQIALFRDVTFRRKHKDHGFAEGMEIAAQILEDGKESIYSPTFNFYSMLQVRRPGIHAIKPQDLRQGVSDVGSMDSIGAAAGAGIGSVAPGLGTAAGGVAGALATSAGTAIGEVIGWLFG
jgi:hypothetical protein